MERLLYFDAEWVPISKDFNTLRQEFPLHADAWERRCKDKLMKEDKFKDMSVEEIYDKEAGFYPEFIKIICISAGYFKTVNSIDEWKCSSFYGHDEKEILEKFQNLLSKTAGKYQLCGKAIKRYDMPFIAKRMAIHGIKIPYDLNNGSKKPWEISCVDIGELWGFGCFQETYTPLDWMCVSLGVPTSKSDISGSQVSSAYYDDNRLEDIKDYCERDVKVTAELERKISSLTS